MIQFDNAYLKYSNRKKPLIKLKNFQLNWHGVASLSSSSGGGKTSFFRLLSGWFIDDHEGWLNSSENIFKDIRYIGNSESLFPWLTVEKNIKFNFSRVKREEIADYLKDVGLDEEIMNYFPYQLSLGMYKRIELIIVLLENPKVLFLDEFFSSLDKTARKFSLEAIMKLRWGKMTWVSTHEEKIKNWLGGDNYVFDYGNDGIIYGVKKI